MQLWIYAPSGQLKSDEHMCLVAQQIVHTNNQWMVQLKECGEHQFEYWDYNTYVSKMCLKRKDNFSSSNIITFNL